MPRTKFIAGNWKMNTTKAQAVELARGIARGLPSGGVQVGVAPPFVYIDAVVQAARGSNLLVGAQDCYHEKFGAFTGEIAVEQLKDVGATFCLIGHSERRHVLHESGDFVGMKA